MNWKVIALIIGLFVISIIVSKVAGDLIIAYIQWAQDDVNISF